jgi:hypothetical protein
MMTGPKIGHKTKLPNLAEVGNHCPDASYVSICNKYRQFVDTNFPNRNMAQNISSESMSTSFFSNSFQN